MFNVSQKFLTALQGDHTSYVKLEVYAGAGASPIFTYDPTLDTANPGATMKIVDGSVTFDKQSSTRARLSNLKLVDPTFGISTDVNTIFDPFGSEIMVYRGIRFPDGTTESVPLGRFRITTLEVDDSSGGLTVTISGSDRSWNANAAFSGSPPTIISWPTVSATYGFPYGGQKYAFYIQDLVTLVYPAATFDSPPATWAGLQNDANVHIDANNYTSFFVMIGDVPWSKAVDLSKTVGCALYFDRTGVCTMTRDPAFAYMNGATPPTSVATFVEGETCTFDTVKRTMETDKAFNRIVVTGEGTSVNGPLYSAPADDNDPNSPTYVLGTFGLRPQMVSNSYMVTQSQADDYARLLLRTTIGSQRRVTFTGVVNPALDIDDVVSITRARVGLNASQFVIDSVTIPLMASASMSAKLREIRALS